MIKLYFAPGACSMASHIALCETGIKFATEKVALKTHEYSGGDYYKVNKKGSVPAIEMTNGQVLTEGSAILQYIGDQAPGSGLVPASGTTERYRLQEWLNYVATEMHKSMATLMNTALPSDYRLKLVAMMDKRLDFLADHFRTNHYLMGAQYTVADAYLFTVLSWAPNAKVSLDKWPTVGSFYERVKSRSATQTAMKAEGLM